MRDSCAARILDLDRNLNETLGVAWDVGILHRIQAATLPGMQLNSTQLYAEARNRDTDTDAALAQGSERLFYSFYSIHS